MAAGTKRKDHTRPPEFWFVQCPHCLSGDYTELRFRFHKAHWTGVRWDWPILRCGKCRMYYSFIESKQGVLTPLTSPLTADEVARPLVQRQMVTYHAIEFDPYGKPYEKES